MTEIREHIGTVIKDMKTVKHPTIPDSWGVCVIFECMGCHKEYEISEYQKPKGEQFLQSLADNKPDRDIYCKECNTVKVENPN